MGSSGPGMRHADQLYTSTCVTSQPWRLAERRGAAHVETDSRGLVQSSLKPSAEHRDRPQGTRLGPRDRQAPESEAEPPGVAWAGPGCPVARLFHQDACVSVPGAPPASPRKRVLCPEDFPLPFRGRAPPGSAAFCLLQAAVCVSPGKQRCPHWARRPQLSAPVGARVHKLPGSRGVGLGYVCAFRLVPVCGPGRDRRRDSLSCTFPRPGVARHHVRETWWFHVVKGTVCRGSACGLCGRRAAMEPCESRTRPCRPPRSMGAVSRARARREACRTHGVCTPSSVLLLDRVCVTRVRETGAMCAVRVVSP